MIFFVDLMGHLWNVREKISGIIAICNLSFHFKRTQFSVILQISKQNSIIYITMLNS